MYFFLHISIEYNYLYIDEYIYHHICQYKQHLGGYKQVFSPGDGEPVHAEVHDGVVVGHQGLLYDPLSLIMLRYCIKINILTKKC